jgi:transcriptional regulator with XRE-family HTH domain
MAAGKSQPSRGRDKERPPKTLALPRLEGVGKRLQWIREQLLWGASLAEMGKLLKVSGNHVKELEYERADLDLSLALVYAKRTGVPLDWIYLGKRSTPADQHVIEQVRGLLARLEEELVMEIEAIEFLPEPENEEAGQLD